jgi:hypothetical protein
LTGIAASIISIIVFVFPDRDERDGVTHAPSILLGQDRVIVRQSGQPLIKMNSVEVEGVGSAYGVSLAPAPFQIEVDEPACDAPDAGYFIHAFKDVDETLVSQELSRMRQQGYPRSDIFLFGHIVATERSFVDYLYSSEFSSDFAPEMNNPFLNGWNYFDYEKVYDRNKDAWIIQVSAISDVSFAERPLRKIVLVIGQTDCVDERTGWDLDIVDIDWMR